MQPKDTMPVVPYPAFLVGRYAAEAMALLREIEAEKGVKPAVDTLPIDSTNPPDLPNTALVETTRMTEAAMLSNLIEDDPSGSSDINAISLTEEYVSDIVRDKLLDIYT